MQGKTTLVKTFCNDARARGRSLASPRAAVSDEYCPTIGVECDAVKLGTRAGRTVRLFSRSLMYSDLIL